MKQKYTERYGHAKIEREPFEIARKEAKKRGLKLHNFFTELITIGLKAKRLMPSAERSAA